MARLDDIRTASIGLRTWPWLKEAVDKLAHAEGRSTARYIERLLVEQVEKLGKP